MNPVPYIQIARVDHWVKNIFILPGMVLGLFFGGGAGGMSDVLRIALGLLAACLVASANYVVNEIMDAPQDRFHPEKQARPIPSGRVNLRWAWAEWAGLSLLGGALGFGIGRPFGWTLSLLWLMGMLYNIEPFRTKKYPYVDVLSEAVNNPIRLALGWYLVGGRAIPPVSIIVAYWMFGAFLMATKRFAEYRQINDPPRAARYRESFAYYNEERLLGSLLFYGSLFAMMSGTFIMRYHIELILASPLIAWAMAYYLHLGFAPDSPAQRPELLFRNGRLMLLVGAAFLACTVLLFVHLPRFGEWFNPWLVPS